MLSVTCDLKLSLDLVGCVLILLNHLKDLDIIR